ncbi:acyltransferase domain-containing protein [Micromonospora profundi]|uniref:acyltransferase domain-containing protein n=1 Tax=Micromonospora profundi TaxID=1420889 RepID=UPI00366594AB
MPAIRGRLGVSPDDAAAIMAGWPAPASPQWTDLALVDVVRGYHLDHGVPDAVSWGTLADLGRNLAIDRRIRGEGWPVMQS